MTIDIRLTVNGAAHEIVVRPTDMLVDVLRERLGYVGTNKVCAQGICGACTVLVDGQATTSCLLLAVQADQCAIVTVEGLESAGRHSPLQDSFMRHGAVQCGYCTPGFLMAATALLGRNRTPARAEIVDALSGNICRCTGYRKIIDAVCDVAAQNSAAG